MRYVSASIIFLVFCFFQSLTNKPFEKTTEIVEDSQEYRTPIKNILNETAKGRKINIFFKNNNKLDDLHKKKLIECIVEHFSKDHMTLSTELVNFYADQIVIEYPTEQKVKTVQL